MKKLVFLTLFTIGVINFSNGRTNSYGLSVGVGNGIIVRPILEGSGNYDLKTGVSVGFQYSRQFSDRLSLQTGINGYHTNVAITPAFYPGTDMTPKEHELWLIYVPVFLKVDLSKYFFINGGLLADIDITKEKVITNQSGMGAGLGIGTEFSITNKFALQLNPYVNLHGIVLTDKENYPERVFDAGIKVIAVIRQ